MAVTVEMREQVSQLYVALFGRAPDAEGLGFWVQKLADGVSLAEVANAMYDTAPARSYYPPFMTNEEIISSFYENVLGRPADTEGLAFWTAKLNAPDATPGSVIVDIIDVVANYDGTDPDGLMSAALFANKVEVAQAYGEAGGDIAGAAAILVGVTDDPATVAARLAEIEGPAVGDTLQLTPDPDNITIAQPDTADTVQGIVDGAGDTSTLTALDKIVGNGFTTVQLAVVEPGTAAPVTTLQNIDTVELIAGTGDVTFEDLRAAVGATDLTTDLISDLQTLITGSGFVSFDAALWQNIGQIALDAGADGLVGGFANLHAGVDLAVGAGVAGGLFASYTDARVAGVWSDKGASISYSDGGNIDATAGAGRNVAAGVAAVASGVDLTVGDVTFAGSNAATAAFGVANTSPEAGDIAVGDVALTGFDSEQWAIYNGNHTADSPAGNVTVGDVLMQVNASGTGFIANSGTGVVGNTTVGDVTLDVGDDASGFIGVGQSGADGAGDVTVGDVALMVGGSASGDISLENYAGGGGATDEAIALGGTSVGDLSIDVDASGSAGVRVMASATTTAAGRGASVGSYAVGDLAVTLAQAASLDLGFAQRASVWGAEASASVGDVDISALDATLAVDASLQHSVYVSAIAGSGAAVGDVAIGPATLDMGINSFAGITYGVFASGSAASEVHVGAVSVGGVAAQLDDGAVLDYSVGISSLGDIGAVNLGDIGLEAGIEAQGGGALSVLAGTDIASLELGDVNVAANGRDSIVTASLTAYASGSIGDVNVGDVSISALSVSANAGVDARFGAGESIGDITVGDLAVTVNGAGASGYFTLSASAASGGTVTVGDLDLSVGTVAEQTASLHVDIDNALGDVVVGDIDLTGTSSVGTYNADVSLGSSADGGITIGTISVSGGDGLADNFGNTFDSTGAGWLQLTPGTQGVTLGGVDYSGYGSDAGVTLDVSGFKGDTTVVGSAGDDTLIDNTGANQLTGGAGADTFTILDGNEGMALGEIDQIMDFNAAEGDTIALSVPVVDVDNYGEAAYDDFSAFLTGADSADKAVWVGLVGDDGFAAVDYDAGGVDYVIQLVGLGSLDNINVDSFVPAVA